MFKRHHIFVVAAAFFIPTTTPLPAETNQETSEPAADPLAKITPPVSIKSLPLSNRGDDRQAILEVTNTSEKTISRLVVRVFLLGKDGSVRDSFPHTNDRWFEAEQGNELRKGKRFTISLNAHRLKPDIVAVAVLAKSVTWDDGTEWPTWAEPAPDPVGNRPVSLRLKGIVKEGDFAAPLIEFFNHSDKGIERLEYQIVYLDNQGKAIHRGRRMRLSGGYTANKKFAHVGEQGVPNDATSVELVLNFVTFKDGSRWTAKD